MIGFALPLMQRAKCRTGNILEERPQFLMSS